MTHRQQQQQQDIYEEIVGLAQEREWLPVDRSDLLGQYAWYVTHSRLPIEVMVSMSGLYAVLLDSLPDGDASILHIWDEGYFHNGLILLPFGGIDALEAALSYARQDAVTLLSKDESARAYAPLLDTLRMRIQEAKHTRHAA